MNYYKWIDKHNSCTAGELIFFCFLILYGMFFVSGSVLAREEKNDIIYNRIENLKKDIEKSKKELENSERKLKQREKEKQNILEKINFFDSEIEVLYKNLRKISNEGKRIEREKIIAHKQFDESSQILKIHSGEYAQRLRSIYKRQKISALEILVTMDSISSMLRGIKMFSILAENDVKFLRSIRTQKQTSETAMRTLTAALQAQISLEKSEKSEKFSLEKTRQDRKILLEEIEHDEELLKKRILQCQQDMEKSQAHIEASLKEIYKKVTKRAFIDEMSDDIKNYNFAGKKGKLPWPSYGKVVSSFGVNVDPKTKTKTTNRGIEIETNHGDPVRSVGSGVVVMTQFFRGYGNFVCIYHLPHYYTIYAHLSDFFVNTGIEIREGDIIGLAGSTGLINDSKSSLLIEILNGKNPENPFIWLQPYEQKQRS